MSEKKTSGLGTSFLTRKGKISAGEEQESPKVYKKNEGPPSAKKRKLSSDIIPENKVSGGQGQTLLDAKKDDISMILEKKESPESNTISADIFYSKKRRLLHREKSDDENNVAKISPSTEAKDAKKVGFRSVGRTLLEVCIPKKDRLLQRITRSCHTSSKEVLKNTTPEKKGAKEKGKKSKSGKGKVHKNAQETNKCQVNSLDQKEEPSKQVVSKGKISEASINLQAKLEEGKHDISTSGTQSKCEDSEKPADKTAGTALKSCEAQTTKTCKNNEKQIIKKLVRSVNVQKCTVSPHIPKEYPSHNTDSTSKNALKQAIVAKAKKSVAATKGTIQENTQDNLEVDPKNYSRNGKQVQIQSQDKRSKPAAKSPNVDSSKPKHADFTTTEGKSRELKQFTIEIHIDKDGHISPVSFKKIMDSIGNGFHSAEKSTMQSKGVPSGQKAKKLNKTEFSSASLQTDQNNANTSNRKEKDDETCNVAEDSNDSMDPKKTDKQVPKKFTAPLIRDPLPGTSHQKIADYPVLIIKPDATKENHATSLSNINNSSANEEEAEVFNVQEVLVPGEGRNVVRQVIIPVSKTRVVTNTPKLDKPPVQIIMPEAAVPRAYGGSSGKGLQEQQAERDNSDSSLNDAQQTNATKKSVRQGQRTERKKSGSNLTSFLEIPLIYADSPKNDDSISSQGLPKNNPVSNMNALISPSLIMREVKDIMPGEAEGYHGGIFLFGAQPRRSQKKISFKAKEKPRNLQEVICMFIDSLIEENQEVLQLSDSNFPIIPINWDREVYAQEALRKPTEFPSRKLQIFLEQFNIELQVSPNTDLDQNNLNNNATSTILHDVRPWMSDDILSLTSASISAKYEAKLEEISSKSERDLTAAVRQRKIDSMYKDLVLGGVTRQIASSDTGSLDGSISPGTGKEQQYQTLVTQQQGDAQHEVKKDINQTDEVGTAVQALLNDQNPENSFRSFLAELESPIIPKFQNANNYKNKYAENSEQTTNHTSSAQVAQFYDGGIPSQEVPFSAYNHPQENPGSLQHQRMLEANACQNNDSDSADEEMRSMSAALTLTSFGLDSRRFSNGLEPSKEAVSSTPVLQNMANRINLTGERSMVNQALQKNTMYLPEDPVPSHLRKHGDTSQEISSMFDLSDDSVDREMMETFQSEHHYSPGLMHSGESKENMDPRTKQMQQQRVKPFSVESVQSQDIINLLQQKDYVRSLDPRLSHLPYPLYDDYDLHRTSLKVEAFNNEAANMPAKMSHTPVSQYLQPVNYVSKASCSESNSAFTVTASTEVESSNVSRIFKEVLATLENSLMSDESQKEDTTGNDNIATENRDQCLNANVALQANTFEGFQLEHSQGKLQASAVNVPWEYSAANTQTAVSGENIPINQPTDLKDLSSAPGLTDPQQKNSTIEGSNIEVEAAVDESRDPESVYQKLKCEASEFGKDPVQNHPSAGVQGVPLYTDVANAQDQSWMEKVLGLLNCPGKTPVMDASAPAKKQMSQNSAEPKPEEWQTCNQFDTSVSQFHGHLHTSVPDEIFDNP